MNPKPKPPLPGGEHVQFIDTGPQAVSPGASRVELIPVGDGGPGPLLPRTYRPKKRKLLLPSATEIAQLPRWARVAFTVRCVQRVQPLSQGGVTGELPAAAGREAEANDAARAAEHAANAMLRVTSDPRDLLIIRSDFEWLRKVAEERGWTDDTPVSPEVFGPLWPPRRVPRWAQEKTAPRG